MALSDTLGILASPLVIIDRRDEGQDVAAIIAIVNQHQVEQIVVGLPRLMNGSSGRQADKVETFVQKLCGQTEVPVEFRDERLTTVSARRLMQAARTKKTRGKVRDDAVAAALILQGYLEEGNRG